MEEQTDYDWLVMIFMVGDNDLGDECVWGIKELYRVGPGPRTALAVQFDSRVSGTLRFDVSKDLGDSGQGDDSDGLLLSKIVEQPEVKLGEKKTAEALRDFVEEVSKSYPSRYRLLILSGHAEGVVGRKILSSRDGFLDPAGINKALEGIQGKIDILGMDSCAMATAEVGYELSKEGKVERLIAAEGFEPDTGWPYYRILELLKENPSIDPKQLAQQIVDGYAHYYQDYTLAGASVDLSSCLLPQSGAVALAVKSLAEKLTNALKDPDLKERIVFAHWKTQSYRRERYVDLYDFCDILETSCNVLNAPGGSGLLEACKKVKEALKDGQPPTYVERSNHAGATFQYSNGVSIYFPWADFDHNNYRGLAFSETAGWGDFISEYVKETRRDPRSHDGRRLPTAPPKVTLGIRDNAALNTKFFPELLSPVKNPPIEFDSGQPGAGKPDGPARASTRDRPADRADYAVDGD